MRGKLLAILGLVIFAFTVQPAVMATDYPRVYSGKILAFPRDYGSHPEFRTEWWYVTGRIRDEQSREYGFLVTFFRHRPGVAEDNPSNFAPRQLLFAHAALTDVAGRRLHYDQRSSRSGFGLAEAKEEDTQVWIGNWNLQRGAGRYRARIEAKDFALDLDFDPSQLPVLQGERGYSRKGAKPANATYYYSVPQLATRGTLTLGGSRRQVQGTAWLDHEWSSDMLSADAVGWDWVAINLKDGSAFMAFQVRNNQGEPLWAGGSYRSPQGELRIFGSREVLFHPRRRWRSGTSGADYPVALRIETPTLVLDIDSLLDDQEIDARRSTGNIYWEGAVRASGQAGKTGEGYLELTGYWRPLRL